MVRTTLQLIAVFLLIGQTAVYAGGSIFGGNGLGEPQIAGGARAVGLAGGGLGLRDSLSFNTNNPALCAFARTTLFSMSGKLGIWSVKADSETERDGEYAWGDLNLFLPVTGRYKIGLGVVPSMKADLKTFIQRTAVFSDEDSAAFEERIVWKGGTTDIHLDNAYRVNDRLSVGLTVAYSFTNMNRDVTLDFAGKDHLNAAWYETALFKGWWTKFGFFWQPTDRLGIGAYYRPRSGGKWELTSETNGGGAAVETKRDGDTPSAMGGGVSFLVRPRLMMTVDVQMQQWKRRDLGILYDGKDVQVSDPLFLSIGFEKQAVHERVGGNMGLWSYRGGFFYRSHYWTNTAGDAVNESGLTLGTSVPIGSWKGRLHLATELGKRGSEDSGATETYIRTSIQIEMSELWFQRGKPRAPK